MRSVSPNLFCLQKFYRTAIIILLEQRASPIFIRHYIAERQSLLLSCRLYHRHVSLVESAEDELCTFLHVRTKRRHVSNEYIAVDISNHYIEAVFNVIKNRRIAKQHTSAALYWALSALHSSMS